jgi:hypothetical protein
MVYDIDIDELNLGPIKDLIFLDEISLKKVCFFFFAFLNNKCIIIFFSKKKTSPYQKGRDFIDGHVTLFFQFSFVW